MHLCLKQDEDAESGDQAAFTTYKLHVGRADACQLLRSATAQQLAMAAASQKLSTDAEGLCLCTGIHTMHAIPIPMPKPIPNAKC